jgi:hypothetical protein
MKSGTIRARKIEYCFLFRRTQGKGHGSSALSRTTGRPAEVLREGRGITVGGTAGDGLTISTYLWGYRESPLAKDLPRLIYHRRALSNVLLLRAVTGTSFFTIRVVYPDLPEWLVVGGAVVACLRILRRHLRLAFQSKHICCITFCNTIELWLYDISSNIET